MTNPVDNEDLYTTIELGGVESPGVCKISGHDRKINWDVKAGSGQTGASTTIKDKPPAQFKVVIYMADQQDFDDWPAFKAQCELTVKDGKPQALDIYHPDLADQDIKSVCAANIGGIVHDGKGGQTVTIDFQEYRPPKKAGGTPKGSLTKAKADPNQAALDELAKLTKQYEQTPWGTPVTAAGR